MNPTDPTPEDRVLAEETWVGYIQVEKRCWCPFDHAASKAIADAIARVRAEARAEEREACAQLAERFGEEMYPLSVCPDQIRGSLYRAGAKMGRVTGHNIAFAIRQRGRVT